MNDARLEQRAIREAFELALADNIESWLWGADGTYKRSRPGKAGRAVQQTLVEELSDSPEAVPEPNEPIEIAVPAAPVVLRKKARARVKPKG